MTNYERTTSVRNFPGKDMGTTNIPTPAWPIFTLQFCFIAGVSNPTILSLESGALIYDTCSDFNSHSSSINGTIFDVDTPTSMNPI